MLSRSFVQYLGSRLMALGRAFADWKTLKAGSLVMVGAAAADAAAALPIPPVERVVVNPAPPATAVPFVNAEQKSKSKKYVKQKDVMVALTESQQRGVGELRDLYTDGPGSRLFIVQATRMLRQRPRRL
jgi:hypothetical protein